MRKLIGCYLAILGIGPLYSKAQENLKFDDNFNLWNIQTGQQATVFSTKAYVRAQPNLKAAIVDSLSVGNVVMVSSAPFKGNTLKNFYAPWHQKSEEFLWNGTGFDKLPVAQ